MARGVTRAPGDVGVSIGVDPARGVTELAPHLGAMRSFHRRYRSSGRILELWARMVRTLPVRRIVPQHGAPLAGQAVPDFMAWAEQLDCGIDRMTEADDRVPA